MLVKLNSRGGKVFGVDPGTLRGMVKGITNKRGELNERMELYVETPLEASVPETGEDGTPWRLSTFDLDRFDERIDPAGWELERYLSNPVVLWAHDHAQPAIGTCRDLRADGKGLSGRIVFNERDWDPFGWAVGERVRRRVIRAGSVGFLVKEVEFPDKKGAEDGTTLIFRRQELLEFSICNVPANPWAVAGGEREDEKMIEGYLELTEGNMAAGERKRCGFWIGIFEGGSE